MRDQLSPYMTVDADLVIMRIDLDAVLKHGIFYKPKFRLIEKIAKKNKICYAKLLPYLSI